MTKIIKTVILGLVCTAFGALPLFAQTGNGAPSGTHYNLNIIGVENPKTSDLSGTDRHTIFVALGKNGGTTSNIYLTPGPFQVCDGNAFDAVHDCTGTEITKPTADGALFQLPCNTNVPADITCGGGVYTKAYEVWARALGQPGSATITTCAFDKTTNAMICSTENVMLVRIQGKLGNPPKFTDVTNQLTSLVSPVTGQRIALFSDNLQDFFWQYQNNGLRLAQLRFYLLNP